MTAPSVIRHVTFDCADPFALATFWSAVTGWPLDDEDEPGDDEVGVVAPDPLPMLLFIHGRKARPSRTVSTSTSGRSSAPAMRRSSG